MSGVSAYPNDAAAPEPATATAEVGLSPDQLVQAISSSLTGENNTDRPAETPVLEPLATTLLAHRAAAGTALASRDDDLPVPMPRTLRDHDASDAEPRLSPITSGALVGLGLGLVLTLGVFLASGGLEGARNAPEPGGSIAQELVTASTVETARGLRLRPSVQPSPGDSLLVARQLIASGDLAAAREILGRAAADGLPDAMHALAETFDPNVLAAWGLRDGDPDPERARRLYLGALAGGHERSRARLLALQ